ncbi:UxaA family hydrolase [Brevundimonas denitrificans]|uniref:UxaA family hydrolase n=1 Tax=Brevundimonas denitrificans TaxID=1443434 RepID=UPI003FA3BC77
MLTSVNCSATVARRIADSFRPEDHPGVDGVVAFTHQGGCGGASMSPDVTLLQRTLAGYARHPNFAGILVVGLGCEANQIPDFMAREGLQAGPALRAMTIQEAGGTSRAIEQGQAIVREMIAEAAKATRQTVSAEHLTVGLQCGGSDGWSGVTANPALGAAVDRLVAQGGSAMLSETPEIWGAEHLLLRRAASQGVADRLNARLDWWRDYAERHQMELNNNPSPGNLKGGLTTILEKSLGAVAKSGSTPLNDVIGYAEPLTVKGLSFMDSPGYDPCSATGQIASGANLIVFTTGRGSVFGAKPAPVHQGRLQRKAGVVDGRGHGHRRLAGPDRRVPGRGGRSHLRPHPGRRLGRTQQVRGPGRRRQRVRPLAGGRLSLGPAEQQTFRTAATGD